MKVLFISAGKNIDYQSDCVFHGLNFISYIELYTINDYWYMYQGNDPEKLLKLYGMGFTLSNRIPKQQQQKQQTQTEVLENIRTHFYDLIIYGSIFRCDTFLDKVVENYSKNEIIFIDGEDSDFATTYPKRIKGHVKLPMFNYNLRNKAISLASKGLYFKRELREKDYKYFFPISFAIPSENILNNVPNKNREVAHIIPGKLDTYIYKNEYDYYCGYRDAKFGITFKKGGWDCLRHYEILANACIPYFPDLKKCPTTTMSNFPKNIIIETNRLFENNKFTEELYSYYCNLLLNYTREFLTTETLAKYILSFTR